MLKIIKFLFVSLFLIHINFSFAAEMCVPNDSISIILDSTIVPSNYNEDKIAHTWSLTTRTGKIVGVAACLSSDYNSQPGSIYTANNGVLIDNGQVVVGGELNSDSNERTYCWCKITHPVVSYWWYRGSMAKERCYWCNQDWCSYWWFIANSCCDLNIDDQQRRALIYDSIDN